MFFLTTTLSKPTTYLDHDHNNPNLFTSLKHLDQFMLPKPFKYKPSIITQPKINNLTNYNYYSYLDPTDSTNLTNLNYTYKYNNTQQCIVIFNPQTKQFYTPINIQTNIFHNLTYCKNSYHFQQKLTTLTGRPIQPKSLYQLAHDLQNDRNLTNNVYDLHFYKGIKGSYNIRYCVLFLDHEIKDSQVIEALEFKNMDLSGLDMNDRQFHKYIYNNYDFMFNGTNSTINYRQYFWIVNDLNLMNYLQFTKSVAKQIYYNRKRFEWGFKGYQPEDFEMEAITIMPKAASKFKFDTNLQFQNYLQYFIRNAIARLKSLNYLEIDKFEDPERFIGMEYPQYEKMEIESLLQLLSKREQFILRHSYGINYVNKLTAKEIGEVVGLSPGGVARAKIKALQYLRSQIEGSQLDQQQTMIIQQEMKWRQILLKIKS